MNMRHWFLSILTLASLTATTLERLSMDQIIAKSTYIVRAKVIGGAGTISNRSIYTKYSLQVIETLKGSAASYIEVLVPGGTSNGMSQSIAGAPKLTIGNEMVLFLWQSPKGNLMVIGMQQGAFDLQKDATGKQFISRTAITDSALLDGAKLIPQTDNGFRMSLLDLRQRILAVKE